MAKIFKVTGYFVDPNDDWNCDTLKVALEENNDLISHYVNVDEKDIGEWEDDNPLNLCECPISECEKFFNGKWKHVAGMNSKCSECGRYFPVAEFENRPFDINCCPHCGAKMMEE